MKHLWEVDHPYYCSESNYYVSMREQPGSSYESWQDFLGDWGPPLDLDMNLLFRWDWKLYDCEEACEHDDNYRCGTLELFYVLQRKGIFLSNHVKVCRADEPAVKEFLDSYWKQMQLLWEPFAEATR